jgi:glycerophosphoryl diester phosphodiesterase
MYQNMLLKTFILVIVLIPMNLYSQDSTIIEAHRGSDQLAPENTLSAFRVAIEVGATQLECDLQFSADDSLMVLHDATVNRTTNGTGSIASLTYAQLRALDAGYPSKFGTKFQGEKIPTIREVFELIKGTGVIILPEIKVANDGQGLALLNIIRSMGMEGQVIPQAGNLINDLRLIRDSIPEIGISIAYNSNIATMKQLLTLSGDGLRIYSNNGDQLFGSNGNNPFPLMDSAEYYGIKMRVWTMNTEAKMLNLMSIGVDMIATDYCHEFIPFQKTLSFYKVVGCWDFNENSGDIVYDLVGDKDGTINGAQRISGINSRTNNLAKSKDKKS